MARRRPSRCRPRAQPTAPRTDDAKPSGQSGFEMMSMGRLETAVAISSAREPTMTAVRATRERQAASVTRWMSGWPSREAACFPFARRGETPAAKMAQPKRDDRVCMSQREWWHGSEPCPGRRSRARVFPYKEIGLPRPTVSSSRSQRADRAGGFPCRVAGRRARDAGQACSRARGRGRGRPGCGSRRGWARRRSRRNA